MNLDELFSKASEKAGRLELPGGVSDALILLDISGDDPRRWLVTFRDGKASLREHAGEEPDVVVSASGPTLISIAERRLKPAMAFFTGRLKIKGDRGLLGLLPEIWPD